MAALWARAKEAVGLADVEEAQPEGPLSRLLNTVDEATTMDRSTRLIGFATCLSIGILFGALGSLFVLVSPRKFAALYSLSNIMSLGSTCFLVGPAEQARSMCAPSRAPAAIAYVASLGLTLASAIVWRSLVLTIAFLAIQVCALAFYALSYIPYARGLASSAVGRCMGWEGW